MTDGKPADGINDETGEYGVGVDQDTGAMVGDTGTPSIKSAEVEADEKDEKSEGN